MAHAILSPSGASRWLACTPSARLEQQFPDRAGEAAAEGTLAHNLGELMLRQKLNLITKQKYSTEFKKIEKDRLYNTEMFGYAEDYSIFVMERFYEAQNRTKDALIFLEQQLNLTDYVPEGFGTGDAVIIADGILDIIDLKYGKGVEVSAENNKQMMLYGLGALREFDHVFEINTVRLTIYQPRKDNFSIWEIAVSGLMDWAVKELAPRAAMAFKGEGEFAPGAHCQFCKAAGNCKARAEFNLELAKYDFKQDALLEDAEIADILDRAKEFKSWLGDVEDYALQQALAGKKYPGYKLVEGRSNRVYGDQEAVVDVLTKEGFTEDKIYNKKLIGITDMEKLIGKAVFNDKLSGYIVKPPGSPTLVPATDKRPEYGIDSAKADFAEAV